MRRPLLALLTCGAGITIIVSGCGDLRPSNGQSIGGASGRSAESATAADLTVSGDDHRQPPPRCTLDDAIETWPLRRRLAQLLIAPVPENDPGLATALVTLYQPGGIFLLRGTYAMDGRLGGVTAGAAPVPTWVAIDEEGGRVQRLEAAIGAIPSARAMAAAMSPEAVEALAEERGQAMRTAGITMDFAPVVDVSSAGDDDVIGDRSFSADPEVVASYAGAFAEGLRHAGIVPVLKHFPGHGRASGDSHQGPVTTPPLDQLEAIDLVPYETLLNEEPTGVMLGHLDVPGFTEPGYPASVSHQVVDLLRERYGFDGVVVTDDLGSMVSITSRFDLMDSAVATLNAGADMVLWGTSGRLGELVDHLEQAVASGALPESRVDESVRRVLTAKRVDPCEVALATT